MRAVKEWIGTSPDSKVPDRVRIRVFDRYDGTCYLSGRKIFPGMLWEIEHIIALINGGENRESNLAPVLVDSHKEKTKKDQAIKSKNYKVRKKHLGIKSGRRMPGSKGSGVRKRMDGTVWKE